MDKESVDELLNTLGFIALHKSWLPFNLRGWVNALGLHVQERKAGQWTRLQAGGSLRSYIDVWQEDDGDWQVNKFDKETWERRFAHLVEPTYEIADFLSERVACYGELDIEGASSLNQVIQDFKDMGVWSKLPKVPEDVKDRLAEERAEAKAQEETKARRRRISEAEEETRNDPLDGPTWSTLSYLYYREQRYKDMENALIMELKAGTPRSGFQYMQLGKMYLATVSHSVRGQGIPIFGNVPSNVTAGELGYSVEQLRLLARENLTKAYDVDKRAGVKTYLEELEICLEVANSTSIRAFEEYDRYKDQESEAQNKQIDESLS